MLAGRLQGGAGDRLAVERADRSPHLLLGALAAAAVGEEAHHGDADEDREEAPDEAVADQGVELGDQHGRFLLENSS